MIKGKAIMQFGKGDILLTPYLERSGVGLLVMQNKGTHIVGEFTSSENFKREEDDTVMTFSNVRSIDVVIERLETLKRMMMGDLSDCMETDISYSDLVEVGE